MQCWSNRDKVLWWFLLRDFRRISYNLVILWNGYDWIFEKILHFKHEKATNLNFHIHIYQKLHTIFIHSQKILVYVSNIVLCTKTFTTAPEMRGKSHRQFIYIFYSPFSMHVFFSPHFSFSHLSYSHSFVWIRKKIKASSFQVIHNICMYVFLSPFVYVSHLHTFCIQ